ncbi:MAG: response regulator transcription factor [Nitrospirae bacterium]|nr:MAG: response regulator transcription factor [Nitrospirota bacterium]
MTHFAAGGSLDTPETLRYADTVAAARKILIIEDERDILDLVRHYLEKEGFRARTAADGTAGLAAVRQEHPDLIVLDLMLPGLDGLELCKKIRADPATALTPVIMLTAKAEESDKIVGLELGADDYLTKPFSPKELVARIKALLRRAERREADHKPHAYGPLRLDAVRHEVKVDGREVPLTAKEFGLLEQLLRNKGRVLTRDVLLNSVWGYDYHGTTRTVDVHIRRLKQKAPLLDEAIVSIKSVGYKLREEDD